MRVECYVCLNLDVFRAMMGRYIATPRLIEGANVTLSSPCLDTDMLKRVKLMSCSLSCSR